MDKTEDYEVYVNAEAIVEICRGPHITVAQAFGEDWTAPPAVHIHAAAFQPPEKIVDATGSTPEPSPVRLPASRRNNFLIAAAFFLACLASWVIARGC